MSWVKLDDQWYDHPKFLGVGDLAQLLWVKGLTYACRHRLKGIIPTAVLGKLTSVRNIKQMLGQLVTAKLWVEVDGGYRIHDFDQYQPVTDRTSEARSSAGKLGAAKRWLADTPQDSNCHPFASSKPIAEQQQGDGSRADGRRAGLSSGSESDPEGSPEGPKQSERRLKSVPPPAPDPDPVADALRGQPKLADLDVGDIASFAATRMLTKGTKLAWVLQAIEDAAEKSQRGEQSHVRHARVIGFIKHARAPKPEEGRSGTTPAHRDFTFDPGEMRPARRAVPVRPKPADNDAPVTAETKAAFSASFRGIGASLAAPSTEAQLRDKAQADQRRLAEMTAEQERKAGGT